MKRLTEIVGRLRSENGCPWDREQTLESLKQYLVEECYELVDAIDSGVADRHKDELGDLLLQVLMQARIREEQGDFSFTDVADTLAEKLVRRHPHVFADGDAKTSAEVLKKWEEIKAEERKDDRAASAIRDLPRHLPALLKAQRVQARVARVGFDWEKSEDVAAKVEEELEETRQAIAEDDADAVQQEVGDLLFAAVNLARFVGMNAEESLNAAIVRFTERFRKVEERVRAKGRALTDCTLEELDNHWNAVKKNE